MHDSRPGRRVAIVGRPPHAVRQERHRLSRRLRHGAGAPRRARAARPERARRPRGGRGDLRPGGAVGARAERGARGEPAAAAPRRACPAYSLNRACASAAQAITNAADQIALGHADVGARRRRRIALRHPGAPLASLQPDPGRGRQGEERRRPARRAGPHAPARPRARHARHRRAVHRRDDGPVGREDGQGERHHPRGAGPVRAPEPPARRRRHRRRPPHRGDRALVRRRRHGRDRSRPTTASAPTPRSRRWRSSGRCSTGGTARSPPGNASPLTDGAAAVLLMGEEKAAALGYEPLAYIRSYAVAAVDPGWQLLMGPVFAVPARARARRRSPGATWTWSRSTRRSRRRCSRNLQAWGSPAWAERLGLRGPGGRGGSGAHQRDGRLDRHRPSVRRHRRPAGHHARERAAPARRAVRAHLDLRAGRHGRTRWSWSATDVRAHHGRRERHRGRHVRPARRAGQQAERRGQGRVRGAAHPAARRRRDPRRGAHLRQARQLHRRRRHRGVHRAHHRDARPSG